VLALVGQRHHDHLAGVEQAFHLEAHEVVLALAQRPGGGLAFGLDQRVHLLAQAPVGDADEAPGLHEADAGGVVGGPQQALQQGRVDRVGAEVAHVAPLGDGPATAAISGSEKRWSAMALTRVRTEPAFTRRAAARGLSCP
jgi:hypothetical protein